jgi:hypothetical protein
VSGIDEARARVRRILDADLEALTKGRRLSVVPAVAEENWDLPDPDRRALWSYGLPPPRDDARYGIVGDYQSGREPELEADGSGLYSIGTCGVATLAASVRSGSVLALSPFTEVHPQLRDRCPDGIRPAPVNSSVTRLVDFGWRYHWLLPVIAEAQTQAARAARAAWTGARTAEERTALPDFFAGLRALCGEIVERFRALDPEAVVDDESFWHEAVMDDR